MFMYFPNMLLYHRLKHKHNITNHNTLVFYVVHYQEGSYIHGNFVYMIFSKGKYKVPLRTTRSLSLSLSLSLRASVHQAARVLSSFSQNDQYIHPYDMQRTIGLCKDIFLLHRKNPPLVGQKTSLAETYFSLCEIRSTLPLQG